MQNVSQTRPPGRSFFEFTYLREFVNSANALGLADATEVRCLADRNEGLYHLRTVALAENMADDKPPDTPLAHGTLGTDPPPSQTGVSRSSTGPVVRWRRWGRRYIGRVLTLGDVRALIADVDTLGLRTDTYSDADGEHALQVDVLPIPHAPRGLVYSISAEPRHTASTGRTTQN